VGEEAFGVGDGVGLLAAGAVGLDAVELDNFVEVQDTENPFPVIAEFDLNSTIAYPAILNVCF
jgi:hypothetical protein